MTTQAILRLRSPFAPATYAAAVRANRHNTADHGVIAPLKPKHTSPTIEAHTHTQPKQSSPTVHKSITITEAPTTKHNNEGWITVTGRKKRVTQVTKHLYQAKSIYLELKKHHTSLPPS